MTNKEKREALKAFLTGNKAVLQRIKQREREKNKFVYISSKAELEYFLQVVDHLDVELGLLWDRWWGWLYIQFDDRYGPPILVENGNGHFVEDEYALQQRENLKAFYLKLRNCEMTKELIAATEALKVSPIC